VIEDKKIVVGQTTTTKCARKTPAKKPASKSSFIQHQNDDYSNDLRKKKGNGITTSLPPSESFMFIVRE
jgi:hypothetical protein